MAHAKIQVLSTILMFRLVEYRCRNMIEVHVVHCISLLRQLGYINRYQISGAFID